MNYYNPYFYSVPYSMTPSKVGLFSKLFGGGKITFGAIINGTQKALGFANQAIPVVRQATPLIKNAKTMFKVMNEFKKNDSKNSFKTNKFSNQNNSKKANIPEATNNIEKTSNKDDGYPVFFV